MATIQIADKPTLKSISFEYFGRTGSGNVSDKSYKKSAVIQLAN